MVGIYTGIGSRKTPVDILTLIEQLAHRLADEGWGFWSGFADGPDMAFHVGAMRSPNFPNTQSINFLPWSGFNGGSVGDNFIVASRLPNYEEAMEIASRHHPVWDKLKPSHKALHTRNVYQILGPHLNQRSRKVICWAPPIGNGVKVKGGTGMAVSIAREFNVPVSNLYYENEAMRAQNFINKFRNVTWNPQNLTLD